MGNEADDEEVIDWNFDHDDLTKAIYNISSENLQWVEVPIFEYEDDAEGQDCEECLSELSDRVVKRARKDNEEYRKIWTGEEQAKEKNDGNQSEML